MVFVLLVIGGEDPEGSKAVDVAGLLVLVDFDTDGFGG